MSTIKVLVHEQSLRVIDGPKIASKGVNENYIKFTFDSSWTGFGKVAIFYMEDDESSVYQSIVESDGTALVPWEVTSIDGKLCFGVAGTNNNVVYTSEIIKYNIVKGVPVEGNESEPPSPTIYQQMLALVGQVQQEFETAQTNINMLVSQMDEFVSDHAGVYGETLIYDADVTGVYLFGKGQDVEPLNNISIRQSNFDFLDIYYIFDGAGYVFTKDYRNYNTEHIQIHAMSTNASTTNITFAQLELALSGSHIRVVSATRTDWLASTGPTIINVNDDYVAQSPSDYPAGYVKKIIGRKLVGDAELVDARVGVDGTTYQTVGEAIRSQIDDVAGGTVELDITLTQQGKAAESKSVGDALALKADKLTTYTKTEVDNAIELASVVVDSELNELSTNAIQNGVVAEAIGEIKADLDALDERVEALESDSGGDGLSSTQKQTLMDVINALGGAFTTPSAQSLVDAFNSAWNVAVTGISLNKSTLSFSALTSETLIATLSPSDATGTVTWVSSDTSVVTVDSNGTVVVVGNGTATITASCGGYSATCAVTVSGIATTYTVTYNLTGCESSNPQTRAEEGSTFTANITPVVGYLLPFTAYTVTMGGTDITASAWSSGTVSVAEVTGDIVISATATVDSRTLLYAWDLTQSLIDTVDNTEVTLSNTVTAGNLPTRDSSGLHFTEAGQVAQFVTLDEIASKVIEMDVASMDFKGNTSKHIRFLNNNYGNAAHSLLIRKSSDKWTAYENGWQTPTAVSGQTIPSDPNAFSGHTVSCEISSSRSMTVYVDGTPIYTIPVVYIWGTSIAIGGAPTGTQNDGQQIFDCTITGLRIYSI